MFSHQATLFVGPSQPGGLALFHAKSRRRLAVLSTGLDDAALANARMAFSADSPSLALYSGSDQPARVRIFSTTDGSLTATYPLPAGVRKLFFCPAGRRAALLFDERAGQPVRLAVLELATGALRQHNLPVDPSDGRIAALSADGTALVVSHPLSANRSRIALFDLATSRPRWSLESDASKALHFSPDGAWVASQSFTTRLYHAASGKLAYERDGKLAAFAANGRALLESTGCLTERDYDGAARVRFELPENDAVRHAVVSSSGEVAVATTLNQEMYWWERATGRPLLLPAARMHGVRLAFSHDGRELIGHDGEYLHRWRARDGAPIDRQMHPNTLLASDSGQRLLAARGKAALEQVSAAGIRATQLAEGRAARLSRDGTRLLVTTLGGSADDVVVDLRSGHVRAIDFAVGGVELSPDGELLAYGGPTLQLIRSATGELVREITVGSEVEAAGGAFAQGVFAPNGELIAILRHEPSRLWIGAVDGGSSPRALPVAADVTTVVFSPDSRWLAVGHGDGSTEVRDVHSGRLVRKLTGHRATIFGLAFSPDGARLATTSADGTALVWRLR